MSADAPALSLNYPWLPVGDDLAVRCCVCKLYDEERTVSQFTLNGKEYEIKECRRDNLMFLSPQPGNGYLDALYNHPSYYTGEDDMYGMMMNDEKSRQIAQLRVEEIRKYAPDKKSLLELGCAYGDVLAAARDTGFTRVAGVEYSTEAVSTCVEKGLDVRQGEINEHVSDIFPGESFDAIALYSVLEHLRDPYAFLSHVSSLMSVNGILVLRVPNTPTEGPHLSLLDHFWHFNEEGLRTLLNEIGYSVVASFPSGRFKGLVHGGELQSVTIIAQRRA